MKPTVAIGISLATGKSLEQVEAQLKRLKVIAFDVFGTVVDLSGVPREEIRDYARHIHKPDWEPITFPKSWEDIPAHPDSSAGIALLRQQYSVVTCSNSPTELLVKLSKRGNINWDAIIPIEAYKVYKPNPLAYLAIADLLRVDPSEVAMVTANPTFGDVEASAALGMLPIVIRQPGDGIQTITDLAHHLYHEAN